MDEFAGAIGVDTSGGSRDGGGFSSRDGGGFNSVGGDLSGGRASEGISVVIDSTEYLSVSNSEESSKDD